MSESPGSQAQSASAPQINGNAGTINGLLQENMTKLQEAVVSTTYTINIARIGQCLFDLILPIN